MAERYQAEVESIQQKAAKRGFWQEAICEVKEDTLVLIVTGDRVPAYALAINGLMQAIDETDRVSTHKAVGGVVPYEPEEVT